MSRHEQRTYTLTSCCFMLLFNTIIKKIQNLIALMDHRYSKSQKPKLPQSQPITSIELSGTRLSLPILLEMRIRLVNCLQALYARTDRGLPGTFWGGCSRANVPFLSRTGLPYLSGFSRDVGTTSWNVSAPPQCSVSAEVVPRRGSRPVFKDCPRAQTRRASCS